MAEETSQQVRLPPPAPRAAQNEGDGYAADTPIKRGNMERTVSTDIREGGQILREAAEDTQNFILDITLDGTMRWASQMWDEVVGIPFDTLKGKPVSDILLTNPSCITEAIAAMHAGEAASKFVRFSVRGSPLLSKPNEFDVERNVAGASNTTESPQKTENEEDIIDLEAQGIMIYDRSTGKESHTMWMIRPAIQREVTIDLPEVLVEVLGDGAELLAQHLTSLAETSSRGPENPPPPIPVLCRICERQITPWFFPKHTELCVQEYQAEAEMQRAQENLTEHRNAIVKVLDGLEAMARQKQAGGVTLGQTISPPEYKGMHVGESTTPSGKESPTSPPPGGKDRPASGLSHHRARSFTVRRPLTRIVELILDLCDTALEINPPALKDARNQPDGEIRTQSPQSENRISQVLQWQSPSTGALDNEPGLLALSEDTAMLSKAKVDSTLLFRRILEYAERIRGEFSVLVQDCIDAALEKAAQIAAGDISSSESSDESSNVEDSAEEKEGGVSTSQPSTDLPKTSKEDPASNEETQTLWEQQPAMVSVFQSSTKRSSPSPSSSPRLVASSAVSTRSNSPRTGASTPRSHPSGLQIVSNSSETQAPSHGEHDPESDINVRPSARSRPPPSASSEPEPYQKHHRRQSSRAENSREHKRKSLVLPRASSLTRQVSPARSMPTVPQSPLRAPKPRLPSIGAGENIRSPVISPTLSSNEFVSPLLQPQHPRHRRQSSEASSDLHRNISPRLSMSNQLPPRPMPPSIKDFEVIKPISKGAFGVVYLAKKKTTGDYYAIKALKKADMISKNQVANVKAERAILMWQGESDFVAKLYWTFPSKDYIFLVMEYLNGGDCASLLQALGTLPEDWAKKYIAEVVQGVGHLHDREIVHRDLKPDNLLIDQKGRLKLTDFGLSRMGLIGRQKRALKNKNLNMAPDPLKQGPFHRSTSIGSSRSASLDTHNLHDSPSQTPAMTPINTTDSNQPSYFNLNREASVSSRNSGHFNESPDSDGLPTAFRRLSIFDDAVSQSSRPESSKDEDATPAADGHPLQKPSSNNSGTAKEATPPTSSSAMPPPPMALFDPDDSNRRFVGTPDYLAPETINGLGQDEMSDWWSMGCILFEFVFGYPPFHADTPEKVFENILTRNIKWPPEDESEVSHEARDLMNKLMCLDPNSRLGVNGTDEIRKHPWFTDIDWSTLNESEPSFIPSLENPEDTEYFDSRGATSHDFATEFEDQVSSPALTPSTDFERPHDALSKVRTQVNSMKRNLMPLHIPPHVRDGRSRRLSEPVAIDDFGQFAFKNLPVLDKANKDVIQKLRAEALQAQSRSTPSSSAVSSHPAPTLESSPNIGAPVKRTMSVSKSDNRSASPSLSHVNSSPSRGSQPPSPMVQFSTGMHHERRKTSSGSASLPQPPTPLAYTNPDPSRIPASLKPDSNTSSPIKTVKSASGTGDTLFDETSDLTRTRSHTIGSSDNDNVKERISNHYKRRSQVLDVSPSSSDTEDPRQKALLRVQRRRQSSRRLSQINLADGPVFRPLDILVCEDHPVSRLVMEKLLEKLKCRTIIVSDGGEAMRYAMSSVKFDIIMMESKLPQINGADVARMIRETKNANCHTPIVAVTGYLKELLAPHHFDALIEKPPTVAKLTDVMAKLCQWKAPPPGWMPPQHSSMPPSNLRKEQPVAIDDSPTSTTSSSARGVLSSAFGRGSSREDSLSSASVYTDNDLRNDDIAINKSNNEDWSPVVIGGLGISEALLAAPQATRPQSRIPTLVTYDTAPADLEHEVDSGRVPRKSPSAEQIDAKRKALGRERAQGGEFGDDEDEELGDVRVRSRSPRARSKPRPSSKLGIEMLRTDSQDSVVSVVDGTANTALPLPLPEITRDVIVEENLPSATTPPVILPKEPGDKTKTFDMDVMPKSETMPLPVHVQGDDSTPKAPLSLSSSDVTKHTSKDNVDF